MSRLQSTREHQSRGDASSGFAANVLAGKDGIVSFDGTSQFAARGVSACGLAAFNFARIGFQIEKSRKTTTEIMGELGRKETVEEIVSICAGWSNDLHLEVDDLYRLPIFERSVKLSSVEYTIPRPKQFLKLLEKLLGIEKSAVLIITRPPEIIACFKFAYTSTPPSDPCKPLFVIFDSHPRPSHPQGAGLSFSTSAERTAWTLSEILPPADESLLDSLDFQWQAQLLANCSGHIFVAKDQRGTPEDAIIQSSLAILSLRAKISELKEQNKTISSDNKRLESEVDRLNEAIQQERLRATQISLSPKQESRTHLSMGRNSHAIAGPSRDTHVGIVASHHPLGPSGKVQPTTNGHSRLPNPPINDTQKYSTVTSDKSSPIAATSRHQIAGAQSIFADNPPPVPTEKQPINEDEDEDSDEDLEFFDMDTDLEIVSETETDTDTEDLSIQLLDVAQLLQVQYDLEDQRLRQEQAELSQHWQLQVTFPCGICLDEQPEDSVARVEECSHTMCRSCLRNFVCSKIHEHRFPILCPICTAASDRAPVAISRPLIEQLGITEEDSQILTEMELAEFTVQVHCRMCKRGAFVDRQDYADVPNIVCPQYDCHNVWCKKCEQSIAIGGPRHSCDGTSELAQLMEEKGWKHCPNCTTPILKESGCNHMTCISPGCNTHFCYVCGGMIVRSALRDEVSTATTAHYRVCQLFEVPD